MANAGDIYQAFVDRFPEPKAGDLKIWWIPQVPGEPFDWRVRSLAEATTVLDMLAAYDDFQFAHNIKPDYSNMGGLVVFTITDGVGEWWDWESDEGDDFNTWREMEG